MKRARCIAALAAVVLAIATLWAFRLGGPNGLQRISSKTTVQTAPEEALYSLDFWPWAYIDSASFGFMDRQACRSVQLKGFVWQGGPGRATWRLVHAGGVALHVDGKEAFSSPKRVPDREPLAVDAFEVEWSGEVLEIELLAEISARGANRFGAYSVSVEEQLPDSSWRRLPEHRLYVEPPTSAEARADQIRAQVYSLAGPGCLLLIALLLLGQVLAAARRRPQLFTIAALSFAGALAVRAVVMIERAGASRSLYALARQSDNYLMFARAELAGSESPVLFGPGATWLYVFLMEALGPGLLGLYAAGAAISSLGIAGLAYGTGRLFGARAAVAAGIVGACYAPLVFYQTTLQAVMPLSSLLAWMPLVIAVCWEGRKLRHALFAGMLIGAAALIRPTALAVIPSVMAVIAIGTRAGIASSIGPSLESPEPRRRLVRTAMLFAGVFLITLPQTSLNWARSTPYFISGNGRLNLLMGINRDAGGRYSVTERFHESNSWMVRNRRSAKDQIHREVIGDPWRAAELQARKVGLLASSKETRNTVNYEVQGLDSSRLLRRLSLGGRLGMPIIAWLGLAGILMSLTSRREEYSRAAPALAVAAVLYAGAIALVIVEGRIRAPLVPLLIPFVGLAGLGPFGRFRQFRSRASHWAPHWAASAAIVLALIWCADHLPRKQYAGEIPGTATVTDLSFGNGLRLIGFEESSGCHVFGGHTYVDCYWKYDGPVEPATEPKVAMTLISRDQNKPLRTRVLTVGSRTYPPVPGPQWPSGSTLKESYMLKIPGRFTGSVQVGVAEIADDGKTPLEARILLEFPVKRRVKPLVPPREE